MQRLGFAFTILVLPIAYHSVQAQALETKAVTATVSGRVTLKGEPARGVTVILQGQNPGESNSPRARTDESGRFYFTGLICGWQRSTREDSSLSRISSRASMRSESSRNSSRNAGY